MAPSQRWFRSGLALTVGLRLVQGASFAQENPEPIVELPKVVVTDNRDLPPPEAWRYAEIPGFEILTNASDKATQRLVQDFQSFSFAVNVVWPGLQPKTSQPVSLIICGKGGKFDVFVPAKENKTDTAQASLFLQDREQSAIIIDYEKKQVSLSSLANEQSVAPATTADEDTDASAQADNRGMMEVDAYRQLYREYLRYLMSRTQPRLPAWVEEGLAQLFMGMSFDSRSITFAKLEDPNEVSGTGAAVDGDFNRALAGRALMPLQEMFAVERDSPTAMNPLGSIWAKQAQAFVHLCLYGESQRYQKSFVTLLMRLGKEPPSEALFKDCFQKSYKEMLVIIRGYQQMAAYKTFEWRLPKGQTFPKPVAIALREATQSEVGRIKGDALRLGGHSEAAHTALVAPYIRGERDPRLLAALGLEEHVAGHDDRAEKFLDAAVAGKVERPRAYLELARMRYKTSLVAPAATEGRFSPMQTERVLDLLRVALSQPPPLSEVYELMADTFMRSAALPKKEELSALYDGVNLFRGRLGLVYETAILAMRMGENKGALSLIEHGIRLAPDENTRARFAELKSSLPPLPATAPASPAAAAKP